MRGWQMAIERVKPIPRTSAQLNLVERVRLAKLTSARSVVDHWGDHFFVVPLAADVRARLAARLEQELGTDDLSSALSYAEEPLRKVLHQMLSLPEYQLN